MSTRNGRGIEILNITVDIGKGKQDQIVVYENDEPNMVARDFANKHNLPQKLEIALSRNIYDLIRDINKEQLYLSNTFSSKSEYSATDCKNYGEKLYAKGLRHKEQVEANKQLLKMKIEKDISHTTSFHPIISEKSKKLARNVQYRSGTELRQPVPANEIEYTFAPKINEKSSKLVAKSSNRIQELYEEAKLKKQRIEEMNLHARKNEFSFKPAILRVNEHSEPSEIVDRLFSSKAGYEQNLEELRKKYEVNKDPETGQQFFKPNIGKNYKLERVTEDIWESLYRHQKRPNDVPEDYPYAPVKMDSKVRTEKIMLKLKIDKYSEAFQQLNPDVNGLITYKNINFNDIDPVLLKLIMPLLEELQELDQPLNFEEFVDSMERLLKTLSQTEKDLFLSKHKKKPEESENSIKKSLSSCDFKGVYSRQVEKKNLTSAKLEIEREKLKILELEGCTFKPQTTKFPTKIFNK